MAAGCGNLQRALRAALAAHISKVDMESLLLGEQLARFHAERHRLDPACGMLMEQLANAVQRLRGIHADPVNDRCLAGICLRHDQRLNAAFAGEHRNRQHSRYRPQQPIKAELANQQDFSKRLDLHGARSMKNADGNREVETGSFLFQIGRSQIDRDGGRRNLEAGVFDRGAHPLARLAHCRVGQADHVEAVLHQLDAGEVDFHVDKVCVNAVNGSAERFGKHKYVGKRG